MAKQSVDIMNTFSGAAAGPATTPTVTAMHCLTGKDLTVTVNTANLSRDASKGMSGDDFQNVKAQTAQCKNEISKGMSNFEQQMELAQAELAAEMVAIAKDNPDIQVSDVTSSIAAMRAEQMTKAGMTVSAMATGGGGTMVTFVQAGASLYSLTKGDGPMSAKELRDLAAEAQDNLAQRSAPVQDTRAGMVAAFASEAAPKPDRPEFNWHAFDEAGHDAMEFLASDPQNEPEMVAMQAQMDEVLKLEGQQAYIQENYGMRGEHVDFAMQNGDIDLADIGLASDGLNGIQGMQPAPQPALLEVAGIAGGLKADIKLPEPDPAPAWEPDPNHAAMMARLNTNLNAAV